MTTGVVGFMQSIAATVETRLTTLGFCASSRGYSRVNGRPTRTEFPASSLHSAGELPHHAMIFAAQPHSYRDLPARLHELAPMFRAERSGVLSGLNRVRRINLDDTHVFCRPDQINDEVTQALRIALGAHRMLGARIDAIRLSRRDKSAAYIGEVASWHKWEDTLRNAASHVAPDYGLEIVEAVGEAAFYGPKLDLQVQSEDGRDETIATVQLDVNQPERFDLSYTDSDGSQQRPVIIHRGTIGSMERVAATLTEAHNGRLPLWLSPIQLCALPLTDEHDVFVRRLVDQLTSTGIRCHTDRHGSLGARIRTSRRRRDALIAITGASRSGRWNRPAHRTCHGYRDTIASTAAVAAIAAAYRNRAPHITWPPHPAE